MLRRYDRGEERQHDARRSRGDRPVRRDDLPSARRVLQSRSVARARHRRLWWIGSFSGANLQIRGRRSRRRFVGAKFGVCAFARRRRRGAVRRSGLDVGRTPRRMGARSQEVQAHTRHGHVQRRGGRAVRLLLAPARNRRR